MIKPVKKQKPVIARSHWRWVSLVCLTLQTTVIICLYSYTIKYPAGPLKYLSSTVVVSAEFLKLAFCTFIIWKDSDYKLPKLSNTFRREILSNPGESLKVMVPATLYALQNNLAFYALSNLDPASYQVAYQLKIPSTAFWSVLVVNQRISRKQWIALALLFGGVSIAQVSNIDDKTQHSPIVVGDRSKLLGLLAVVACCMSSGFSGVYFERLIKFSGKQSVWVRNFQLALFCFTMSLIGMLYQDFSAIQANGLFQGYNYLTWFLVFLQAFGGLIVATVVKHADNILKGFATSISIIFSTQLSYMLFDDFNPSANFYIGAATVIVSTILYSA